MKRELGDANNSNLSKIVIGAIIYLARVSEREFMVDEIVMKTVLTVVGFVVTGSLGYLVAKVKEYRKKDNNQENALKCLLRSAITSKYYVYTELGSIPTYEKENIAYMYEQYKAMGGNSYIDNIMRELNTIAVKK